MPIKKTSTIDEIANQLTYDWLKNRCKSLSVSHSPGYAEQQYTIAVQLINSLPPGAKVGAAIDLLADLFGMTPDQIMMESTRLFRDSMEAQGINNATDLAKEYPTLAEPIGKILQEHPELTPTSTAAPKSAPAKLDKNDLNQDGHITFPDLPVLPKFPAKMTWKQKFEFLASGVKRTNITAFKQIEAQGITEDSVKQELLNLSHTQAAILHSILHQPLAD